MTLLVPRHRNFTQTDFSKEKVRRIWRAFSKKQRKHWGTSREEGRGYQGFAFPSLPLASLSSPVTNWFPLGSFPPGFEFENAGGGILVVPTWVGCLTVVPSN